MPDQRDFYPHYIPEVTTDLSNMEGDGCHMLYRHWDNLRQGRDMPASTDFSLMDVYKIAPRLILLDVVHADDGQIRHLYRFVGTKIVDYRRRRHVPEPDHTGKYADEATRYFTPAPVSEFYIQCTELARPLLAFGVFKTETKVDLHERLALPLSDNTGAVHRLIVCVHRPKDL
jgi:hypothetical protein